MKFNAKKAGAVAGLSLAIPMGIGTAQATTYDATLQGTDTSAVTVESLPQLFGMTLFQAEGNPTNVDADTGAETPADNAGEDAATQVAPADEAESGTDTGTAPIEGNPGTVEEPEAPVTEGNPGTGGTDDAGQNSDGLGEQDTPAAPAPAEQAPAPVQQAPETVTETQVAPQQQNPTSVEPEVETPAAPATTAPNSAFEAPSETPRVATQAAPQAASQASLPVTGSNLGDVQTMAGLSLAAGLALAAGAVFASRKGLVKN